MKPFNCTILLLASFCALALVATGAERPKKSDRNLLFDPGFELCAADGSRAKIGKDNKRIRINDNVSVTPWEPVQDGYTVVDSAAHSGRHSAHIMNDDSSKTYGMLQTVYFDQPTTSALRFGAWSRCKDVGPGDNYDVYIDAIYENGEPLWGVTAPFFGGTHDWKMAENVIIPRKPIKELKLYVFLRKTAGEVWFDDVFLEEINSHTISFRSYGGQFGSGSCFVTGAIRWMKPGLVSWIRVRPAEPDIDDFTPFERKIDSMSFSYNFDIKNQNNKPARHAIVSLQFIDPTGKIVDSREQKINLSAKQGEHPFYVWTVPSTQRVFLHSRPDDSGGEPGVSPDPVGRIEFAGNEYESFQIALLSRKELKNIRFDSTDLVHKDKPANKIGKEHIQWQQVGYIRADRIVILPCDTEGVSGWWPDPLLPVDKGIAPADKTVAFWFTVFAPAGTVPGQYQGTITITADDNMTTKIPVVAQVRNFTLDQEGHLPNAFALMNGYLEKVYARTPDTKLRTAYGEFMLRHRLTPEGDISRTDMPVVEELEQYRGRGLGKFNLVNMVTDRGKRTWVCNSPATVYTPEFKKKMYAKIKPAVDELRRRGLAKDAYIYTFDETNKEYEPAIREFFGMIKEHFPEIATFTTARLPQRVEELNALNIDWLCPISNSYNYNEAEKCRAAGKKIWSYICCGPGHPYANIMCRFPLIEARILGWQSYEQKYDGLLYWGVNIWSSKSNVPFDPNDGIFLDWSIESVIGHEIYGDGHLIYANKNGEPIGSIRLAVLRDGFEDYEYLYLLAKKLGNVDEARKWCQPVFLNPRSFTLDDHVLKTQRSKIADRIEQ